MFTLLQNVIQKEPFYSLRPSKSKMATRLLGGSDAVFWRGVDVLDLNKSSSGVHSADLSRFHFQKCAFIYIFSLTFLPALNGLEKESVNPPWADYSRGWKFGRTCSIAQISVSRRKLILKIPYYSLRSGAVASLQDSWSSSWMSLRRWCSMTRAENVHTWRGVRFQRKTASASQECLYVSQPGSLTHISEEGCQLMAY